MVFHDLTRPFAELHSTLIIHLKADCNNHLKIVMILLAADLPVTFGLNCQVFLDSCLWGELSIGIDAFDMLGNRLFGHSVQCRHHLLCQPDILILVAHFIAGIGLTCGRHKGQVFRRRTADHRLFSIIIFISLHFSHSLPSKELPWKSTHGSVDRSNRTADHL